MIQRMSNAEVRSWSAWIGDVTDGLAFAVSPAWGASRKATRMQWNRFSAYDEERFGGGGTYHDGASRDRLHGPKWAGQRISPDSALESGYDLTTLRLNSHELYRSDSLGGAVDSMVDLVVSQGFSVRPKIRPVPGISEDAAKGFGDAISAMMERWSDAVDISRADSWWEIDCLVCRHLLIDGEAFIAFWNHDDRALGVPIPLFLEVIDPERIETPPEKFGDPMCRMGVQHDQNNRILGYWCRTTHPYDQKKVEMEWIFIPKSRCCHVIERWFTGQSRGYPWMTRILNEVRDGKDLHEAALVTAQTEACLSVWVKGGSGANPTQMAKQNASGYDRSGRRIQTVEPGSVNYLANDEEPLFMNPSSHTPISSLLDVNDRRVSAGLNMPYEFIARNWSGDSFAGGRLVLTQAKLNVGRRQLLMVKRYKSPVYRECVRQGVIGGAVEINARAYDKRPFVYQRHEVHHPLWQFAITPGEEITALKSAVDANFTTQEAATAQYSGMEWDDVIVQREKELGSQRKANILSPDERQVEALAQATTANAPQKKEEALHA